MFGLIRTVSPDSTGWEASLWYALRGAGGSNFGVVTELTLAMENAPSKTVGFSLYHNTGLCPGTSRMAAIGFASVN